MEANLAKNILGKVVGTLFWSVVAAVFTTGAVLHAVGLLPDRAVDVDTSVLNHFNYWKYVAPCVVAVAITSFFRLRANLLDTPEASRLASAIDLIVGFACIAIILVVFTGAYSLFVMPLLQRVGLSLSGWATAGVVVVLFSVAYVLRALWLRRSDNDWLSKAALETMAAMLIIPWATFVGYIGLFAILLPLRESGVDTEPARLLFFGDYLRGVVLLTFGVLSISAVVHYMRRSLMRKALVPPTYYGSVIGVGFALMVANFAGMIATSILLQTTR